MDRNACRLPENLVAKAFFGEIFGLLLSRYLTGILYSISTNMRLMLRFVFYNSAGILSSPSTGFLFVFSLDPGEKTSYFERPLLQPLLAVFFFRGGAIVRICIRDYTSLNSSSIVSHCLTIVDIFPL